MPAPNTAAEIGREVVDRMVAHCRHVATKYANVQWKSADLEEVRAIVALLPEPIDPDLIEARKLACEVCGIDPNYDYNVYVTGQRDSDDMVQNLRAGIKRGRELALKARAVGEGE